MGDCNLLSSLKYMSCAFLFLQQTIYNRTITTRDNIATKNNGKFEHVDIQKLEVERRCIIWLRIYITELLIYK